MSELNVDSLRVDCLKETPRDQDWSQGWLESGEVVQPFSYEDFEEDEDNEEKTGYYDHDDMMQSNAPMMNYCYPLPSRYNFDEEDAKKINHLPLCIVYFTDSEEYALVLTGGGMDLSWQICEAHIRLGYYPPTHFRLPGMAGKVASPKNLAIVEACIKGRELIKGWADNDIRDLEFVRSRLSELEPKGDKNAE